MCVILGNLPRERGEPFRINFCGSHLQLGYVAGQDKAGSGACITHGPDPNIRLGAWPCRYVHFMHQNAPLATAESGWDGASFSAPAIFRWALFSLGQKPSLLGHYQACLRKSGHQGRRRSQGGAHNDLGSDTAQSADGRPARQSRISERRKTQTSRW